jgi:trans-2,3-dihydro-3-hydroxyanthranilate isomerase
MTMTYVHVDVFSVVPYSGNSLAVFPEAHGLTTAQMLRITQELRHFESIFLEPTAELSTVRARVFDLKEELPFAGHPLIGGAAVLHRRCGRDAPQTWRIELPQKTVSVTTDRTEAGYYGVLDQGRPEFLATVDRRDVFAAAFGLRPSDLNRELPLEVVSTGLRYLIIPVTGGALERARIHNDITELLKSVKAQFAVLYDEASIEARHWNNDGIVEDVATGSAAGTIGAYRLRHRRTEGGAAFILKQGQYAGRPSVLRVQAEGTPDAVRTVKVGGDVALVGRGALEVLP